MCWHKVNCRFKCQVYSTYSSVIGHSAIVHLDKSCMITNSDKTIRGVKRVLQSNYLNYIENMTTKYIYMSHLLFVALTCKND